MANDVLAVRPVNLKTSLAATLRACRGTGVAKAISVALVLLLVQGCHLTLSVPVGGNVISSSNMYDCAEGQTCVLDLNIGTVFPEQTYTAVPAPGYRFVAWKDEGAHLCRGLTTACDVVEFPANVNALEGNIYLAPIFDIELLDLIPATTRGVFQVYPGQPGAMDTAVGTASSWSQGPLQILQQFSAGMDIAGEARRLVLAQLSDSLDQFVLLANLETLDVNTLTAGRLTATGTIYQGYPLWTVNGTDLQLAKLDGNTLAIGPGAALEQALDVYAGAKPDIDHGLLANYLGLLRVPSFANSLVYGLPALYDNSITAPGGGEASLNQAYAVSSAFRTEDGVLSGALNFATDNAQAFRTELLQQLDGAPGPTTYALNGDTLVVNLAGLSAEDDLRPLLKSLYLDMNAVDYAAAVVHGGNVPWMNFRVGENPSSVYINFEFRGADERAAFEAAHMPDGFTLAPLRILASDPARYILTLNLYQSSGGLVEGARAEWSVFTHDPDTGEPRYLVIQAAAATISADSVNLLTSPEPVTHEVTVDAINSYVGIVDEVTKIETTYFQSSITWPQVPEVRVPLHREFAVSNDYIFWGNAVADRTLYNSTVHNREVVLIDNDELTFIDNSPWSAFINPAPVHSLVYLNPLDIVISPWWNLDEDYLDVTAAYLDELIGFKNNFYPGTVQRLAGSAIRGEGLALRASTVADSVPTVHYHFPLDDAQGLLDAVAGEGSFTPASLELFDGELVADYLTLVVYQREGDPCGTRAEWLTYVAGPDGRPDSLRLDAFAADACLDPVSLMTPATNLAQDIQAGWLTTQIDSPLIQFEATVELGLADTALVGLDWIEAGDRVCTLNGICDEFYADGQTLLVPAQRAESGAVQIQPMTTPWDTYINADEVRVSVRTTPSIQAFNTWRNLRTFAADSPVP